MRRGKNGRQTVLARVRANCRRAGGNRSLPAGHRRPLAVSVIAMLVVIALAAGIACGVLLARPRVPRSLQSTTTSGSINVARSRFDDARKITATVHVGSGQTVRSPESGTVTALTCAQGSTIASGTSFIAIDETPVLALHTDIPPYRDLKSGMRGGDAKALNAELRRLGYAAPEGETMTWDTILAYNALADAVGAARLVKDNGWVLSRNAFIWLNEQSAVARTCAVDVGTVVDSSSELLTTSTHPRSVTLTMPQDDVVAGERVLEVDGRMIETSQRTTTLTDASQVDMILGGNAYRQAAGAGENAGSSSSDSGSDEGNGGANGAGGDGGVSVASSDVSFSLQWRLKTPLDVWSLPPTALYDQQDDRACVVSDGKPVAVTVIGSQLGRSMVTVDSGATLGKILTEPHGAEGCR